MKKKEKILLTLLISITTILITAITYSFFVLTVSNENAQEVSITTGSVSLVFADGKETFEAAKLNLGESATKTFVVTNNNEVEEKFHMYFKDLLNTYMNGSLTYTLEYSSSEDGAYDAIVSNKNVPTGDEAMLRLIASDLRIPANTTYYYKLTITFNELGIDQTADLKAVLNTKFTITNGNMEDSFATLVALGLENGLRSEPTDYNMFNYTWAGYNRDGKIEGIGETQGIYSMEDDFGISYYFRGPKTLNNIVKFGTYDTDMYYYRVESGKNLTGSLEDCQVESSDAPRYCTDTYKYASAGDDMYWRIVRINGDGTLRLLYIGTSPNLPASAGSFSTILCGNSDPKYCGYTYDNSAPDAGDGTASNTKIYLDAWYSKTMIDEDVNVALAQFYCDTSGYSYYAEHDRYYYSTSFRLNKYNDGNSGLGLTDEVSPMLKTSTTTQTYGGRYNLKVGLINVDELVISGIDGVMGSANVLPPSLFSYTASAFEMDSYRTMSPYGSTGYGFVDFIVSNGGSIFRDTGGGFAQAYPVINLTKEYARTLAWDAEGYYVAP